MNIKRINEFFGYMFFVVGVLKLLFVILVIMQMVTNLNMISNGGVSDTTYYPALSGIVGFAELIILVASIIMSVINIKKSPNVIPGYLLGLVAVLLEFIIPSILSIFYVFAQCRMFMKAGSKIRNNTGYGNEYRTSNKTIKNTEWFYEDNINNLEKNKKLEIKKQKQKEKLDRELIEWKQLLESGEIDEQTYTEETNKLIEKAKRKWGI